jgi:site-specific DNA-methyltransferase (adenine-specific)
MLELNKIYNGDCLELMKRISDKSIDFAFISPPYNRKRNDKYTYFDDNKCSDYLQFLKEFTDHLLRVCTKNVFINIMKNYYNKIDVYNYIAYYANAIDDIFIWEKSNPLPANGNNITNSYEFIICFRDLKSNTTYTKNHITSSVTHMPVEHKAVMNPIVAEYFIKQFTKENDIILDPFMGSGTTAVACLKLKRNYIGFEISKEYCDLAEKRIKENKRVIRRQVL